MAPADRDLLGEQLAVRFQEMMSRGLMDEVRRLHARGDLHAGMPALRLIGYRQLWAHVEGRMDLDDSVSRAIIATRQLARRQLTWLRAEPGAEWFDTPDPALIERRVRPHQWLDGCSLRIVPGLVLDSQACGPRGLRLTYARSEYGGAAGSP